MASPILGKHPLSPLSRNKDEDKSSHRASGSCLEQKRDVGTGKGQWERRLEGAPEASGASNSAYRWWDTPESKESMRRKLSGCHRRNSESSPGGRWQEACQGWRRRRRAALRQGWALASGAAPGATQVARQLGTSIGMGAMSPTCGWGLSLFHCLCTPSSEWGDMKVYVGLYSHPNTTSFIQEMFVEGLQFSSMMPATLG